MAEASWSFDCVECGETWNARCALPERAFAKRYGEVAYQTMLDTIRRYGWQADGKGANLCPECAEKAEHGHHQRSHTAGLPEPRAGKA